MKKVLAGLAMLASMGSAQAVLLTNGPTGQATPLFNCGPDLCLNVFQQRDPITSAGQSFNDYYTFNFNPAMFVPANPGNGSATGTFGFSWPDPLSALTADGIFTAVNFYRDNGVLGAGGGDVLLGTSTITNGGVTAFPAAVLIGAGSYYLEFQGTYQANPQTINRGVYSGFGTIAAIPEPSEWALMLSGLGLMGFMARRRRNAAQA